jgi:hypothetical protein
MLPTVLPTVLDAFRADRAGHVLVERHGEFGLATIEFNHPVDGFYVDKDLVDGPLADAMAKGVGTEGL